MRSHKRFAGGCCFKRIFFVVALALGACNFAPVPPRETPTPVPTLEPLPEFIVEAWPAPTSRTLAAFYQADLLAELGISGYEGPRPVAEIGHRSNICIYLDTGALTGYDEAIYAYDGVVERTTLSVDGQELMPEYDEQWYPVSKVGTPGYPHWLCWPAKLEAGIHKVNFQFSQDERIEQYSWFFEITPE